METKTKSSTETITQPGAYTPYHCVTKDEREFFNNVVKLQGVSYEPIAVANQVVNGVNYRFFCNVKIVYPGSTNEAAIVTIYKPIEGNALITEIRRVF